MKRKYAFWYFSYVGILIGFVIGMFFGSFMLGSFCLVDVVEENVSENLYYYNTICENECLNDNLTYVFSEKINVKIMEYCDCVEELNK